MPNQPNLKKKNSFNYRILDNFSYKIVSLFIAFVLWISILGRRDFVSTQELELNLLTSEGYSVLSQSTDRVRLKISGQQPLMKKFKTKVQSLVIDVSEKDLGIHDMEITANRLELPEGIKVLNIRPNTVKFEIIKK